MSDPITVLIIDDEPLARRGLQRMLDGLDHFVVVGEARDGHEALGLIRSLDPDLILLDIEMPAGGAFELIENLGGAPVPVVILVTAFSDFGMEAFDAGAVDYVLKPVDPMRLRQALDRERPLVQTARRSPVASAAPEFLDRIVAKIGGRILVIPTKQIHWIESRGSYLHVHTGAEEHLVRRSLSALEERLDPALFARVHRSYLVALDQIQEMRPAGHGDAVLRLRGGEEVPVSRRQRAELARRLGTPRDSD